MTELGEIPQEWDVISFFNFIEKIIDFRGRTPKKLGMDWGNGNIVALSANNVKMGKIDFNLESYYASEELYKKWMSGNELSKGDILMTMEAPLGNIAIVPDNNKYILSQRVVAFKTKDFINNTFMKYMLMSDIVQSQLEVLSTGTTAKGINQKNLAKAFVIIPTLKEQEKIASILSTVDEQIDNVDALIEKNKELKKGLMQTLLTKGIGHTKFKKTEIGEIPEEWSIKTIGDVINLIKSGLSRSLKDEDIGIPCIRSNNINNYKFDKSDLKYWFLEDNKGANINDYILREGDILVNFINSLAQIGKTCLYKDIGRPVIYTTNIFRMNLNEQIILNKYFYYISQTEMYNNEIKLITKPAVNQASFTVADFKSIKISVPPINEQIRIVSILSEVDEKVEESEEKKQKLEELKKGLMQQLLTGKIRV